MCTENHKALLKKQLLYLCEPILPLNHCIPESDVLNVKEPNSFSHTPPLTVFFLWFVPQVSISNFLQLDGSHTHTAGEETWKSGNVRTLFILQTIDR